MHTHIRQYLHETSIHGFRHLDTNDHGSHGRAVWAMVILVSFITSGTLIWNSVQHNKEYPVATTSDFVPIQEVEFPSVTVNILPKASSAHPMQAFYSEILGQLKFDCSQVDNYTPNDRGQSANDICMDETKSLRDLVQPATQNFVKYVLDRFLNHVNDEHKKANLVEYMVESGMCHFLNDQMRYLGFVPSLKNNSTLLQNMFMTLARDMGNDKSISNSLLNLNSNEEGGTDTSFGASFFTKGCRHFIQYDLESFEQAALLTMLNFELATRSNIKMERIEIISREMQEKVEAELGPQHTESFPIDISRVYYFRAYLASGFIASQGINCHNTTSDGQTLSVCGTESKYSQDCCKIESDALANYELILKLEKYLLEPASQYVQELNHFEEIHTALSGLESKDYHKKEELGDQLLNIDPIIIACSYGTASSQLNINCSHFTKTFTDTGFGYTFNQIPFHDMYQKNNWSEIVYDELIKKTVSFANVTKIRKPEQNGPGNSLSMILRVPRESEGLFPTTAAEQRVLGIGSSNSIANLASNGLVITAGLHYKVMVTPVVTAINENLLDFSPSERGCMHKKDDHNLTLFAHYTHENCLFECQMLRAIKKCGCIPLDFPRVTDNTPICLIYSSPSAREDCFYSIFLGSSDSASCLHCMVDCETVSYSNAVLTKPIDVAGLCPFYKKTDTSTTNAVMQSVGNRLEAFNEYGIPRANAGSYEGYPEYNLVQCKDHVRENLAVVDVYVAPAMAARITRSRRVTFAEQLADFGGVVALFTGMSILSVFELVMWCAKIPSVIRRSSRNY